MKTFKVDGLTRALTRQLRNMTLYFLGSSCGFLRFNNAQKVHLENPIQKSRFKRGYAQTLILVKLIVVKIIGFLVITRNPVGISGPY